MSSSSDRPELFRNIFHPAMSVACASLATLSTIYLFAALLGLPGPRPLTVAGVILAAFVEAAVGNILFRERAGFGNRFRELVIFLLLFYVLFSLSGSGPIAARFTPGGNQLLPLLALAVTWSNAFSLHNRLRGREGLLRTFAGKHADELRRALIDRQHDMALTVREMRAARGGIAGTVLLLSVVAVVTASGVIPASELPAGGAAFVLFLAYSLVAIMTIGVINMFIEEYAAHGDGLRVPLRFHRRRFISATVVVVTVAAVAFGLSRRSSLLPFDSIVAFFRWLGSLFDRDRSLPPPEVFQGTSAQENRYQHYMEMHEGWEPTVPPLWLRMLLEFLRRLGIAVAAAAASILIFGPLFSPAFREGITRIRPRQFARELWHRFVRRMRVLGRWLRSRGSRRRAPALPGGEPGARTPPQSRSRWRPGVAKRRQMDRVVAVFVSITKWGAEHGLRYRHSEAAGEYLSRVATVRAELFTEFVLCREVFWEARYSRHVVPLRRMREYVRAARRITGSG
jgi:hypothetical protein